jgi:hypothetical protein
MFFAAELCVTHPFPRTATLIAATVVMCSCAPKVHPTAPPAVAQQRMSEFWEDRAIPPPAELILGVGGRKHQPDPDVVYEALRKDTSGFSDGYDVVDPSGLEWSVKIGDEAQSEVAASRLLWAMGYRQPPVYYLPEWQVKYEGRVLREGPARFRPKLPHLKDASTWSWHQNPFVGTQSYRGLLVLMMVINSTDLKADNNALYEWRDDRGGTERWYVVKDLGASFGTTGIINPKRNDIGEFEEHGFIDEVTDERVEFEYKGRHKEILEILTPADVRWMCDRLARLGEAHWRAIFRAAGHSEDVSDRYVRKLKEKIAQGRALDDAPVTGGPRSSSAPRRSGD